MLPGDVSGSKPSIAIRAADAGRGRCGLGIAIVLSKVDLPLPRSCSNSIVCLRIDDFAESPDVLSDTTSFCGLALADATCAAERDVDLIRGDRIKSSCSIGWVAAPFFTKDLAPATAAAATAPVAVVRAFVGELRLVGRVEKACAAP